METIRNFFSTVIFSLGKYDLKLYNIILLVITLLLMRLVLRFYRAFINKNIRNRDRVDHERADLIYRIGRILINLVGFFLVLGSLSLYDNFDHFMDYELISGKHPILVRNVFSALITLLVAILIIRLTVVLIRNSIRRNEHFDKSREFTVIRVYKYFTYFLAIVLTLYVAGVNLEALIFGSAGLLVILGLGIQHLFGDFISGLVLLFEDSFDVGDVILMDGQLVQVKEINLRTSKVAQKDGNILTIPNRLLTDNRITNWTQESQLSAIEIPVSVAYGSDIQKVEAVLNQCALMQPEVDKRKPIKVYFENFGDSSLDFILFVWITDTWNTREISSDLRFKIDAAFRKNNIEIPFPQRDLHIRGALPQLG